jgi:hypothetical protein
MVGGIAALEALRHAKLKHGAEAPLFHVFNLSKFSSGAKNERKDRESYCNVT